MGIDMNKTIGKIGSIIFLILIGISQTSCAFGTVSEDISTLMMENQNPNPPVITGPLSGKINKIYNYEFLLTDPDGDSLTKILIEWGYAGYDNITYICFTCGGSAKPNGTVFVASHSWTTKGNFTIRAKVWDTQGNESDWGTLTVTMPLSYNLPCMRLWERFFERHPNALPILRSLLGS